MLQRHADGLCVYARFKLTTVRIEAGNVAIGIEQAAMPLGLCQGKLAIQYVAG